MTRKIVLLLGILMILGAFSFVKATVSKEEPNKIAKEGFIYSNNKEIVKVSMLHDLNRKKYLVGESIDLTGLKLKITYEDGIQEIIEGNDERFVIPELKDTSVGEHTLLLFMNNNKKNSFLCRLFIEIVEDTNAPVSKRRIKNAKRGPVNEETIVVTDTVVKNMPDKSVYLLNEEPNFTGLTFNLVQEDETVIDEEYSYSEESFTIYDWTYDSSISGVQYVFIAFDPSEVCDEKYVADTVSGYITVCVPIVYKENIDDKVVMESEFVSYPYQLSYSLEEDVSLDGATVIVTYDDETQATISLNSSTIKQLFYTKEEGVVDVEIEVKHHTRLPSGISVRYYDPAKELISQEPIAENVGYYLDATNIDEMEEMLYTTPDDEIPAKYNLMELYAIAVENQNPLGLCNLFSQTKSAETNAMISSGKTVNYSERHIDYMMSSKLYGNRTIGNINNNIEGDAFPTEKFLTHASIIGFTSIEEIPFQDFDDNELAIITNADITARLDSWITIGPDEHAPLSLEQRNRLVKKHVMQYGSVQLAANTPNARWEFYNKNTYSMYWAKDMPAPLTGHAMSIVGWDDHFSKANFKVTPPADGAWIVLNSWGEDWGNGGLLYISYYDEKITNNLFGAISVDTTIEEISYKTHLSYQFSDRYGADFINDEKKYYYIPFSVSGEEYLTDIRIPTGDHKNYSKGPRIYLINQYDGTNIDEYEYVGELNDLYTSRDVSHFVFDEPYELKGNQFVILVEVPKDTIMINTTVVDSHTYYTYNTLSDDAEWIEWEYEFPIYIETISKAQLDALEETVTVDSIEIAQIPSKLIYFLEEDTDFSDGKIKVNYTDGTSEIIDMTDDKVFFSGYTDSNARVGEIPITVYYEGKTATFSIQIRNDVTKIELNKIPKTEMFSHTIYPLEGSINAYYHDGTIKEYPLNSRLIQLFLDNQLWFPTYVEEGEYYVRTDDISVGSHQMTILFLDMETSYQFTIYDGVVSGEMIQPPDKTKYFSGEAFDFTGMQIQLLLENGECVIFSSADTLCRR